jgi:CRISPR-associated endonuclease Csn1
MLEAMKRLKRGEPVVKRTHPERADAKFVMSLSSREMVLADWKGEEKLLTFKTAASTQGQIYFAVHTDARRSSDQAKFVATANSLDARKVTIDPLGRIRWAND